MRTRIRRIQRIRRIRRNQRIRRIRWNQRIRRIQRIQRIRRIQWIRRIWRIRILIRNLDCLGYFKTQIIIISSSSCGVTLTQFMWQTIKGF